MRKRKRPDADDVQRLIGTEAVARLERLPRHHHQRLEAVERLEIGDARNSRLELAAFLLVLGDRQRQRPLRALDRRCRVAHLLIGIKSAVRSSSSSPAAATLPRKSVKTVLNIAFSLL